jgi:acyl-CoA synthetase (AMP-forming)/AMP-acid ligase II
MPDTRFGEIVTLVASRKSDISETDLIEYVKNQIATYKAPRRIVFVDAVYRSPSGKADYRWAKEVAQQ